MQVKILGIAGSPRRGGNTELLLDKVLEGASKNDANIEKIVVRNLKISPCIECDNCFTAGECIIDDDMQSIYPKLLETDRLVFASPIFFMGITGWVKAMVDRCQSLWAKKYILKEPIVEPDKAARRKGVFISTGGTKGVTLFEGAIREVNMFFDAIEMSYAGELLFRRIDGKGEILKHPTAMDEAFELGRKLAEH